MSSGAFSTPIKPCLDKISMTTKKRKTDTKSDLQSMGPYKQSQEKGFLGVMIDEFNFKGCQRQQRLIQLKYE